MDGHGVVEHEDLLTELQRVAKDQQKAERLRAIQALRYTRQRREGLVTWKFDMSGVERKDLIDWARGKIQRFFGAV